MRNALLLTLIALPVLLASEAATAQQGGGVACVLGDHEGIAPPDARSATALVCDEIARLGVAAGGMLSDPAAATELYVVDILPLGRTVILRVSYEAPVGRVQDSRSLTLSGLEETPRAAPRIAGAIVNGTALEDTATVDSLVEEETRVYKKKHGEFMWGVGIIGTHVPGLDVPVGPGVLISLYYETPNFAVGSEMRMSGGVGEDDQFFFYSWGIGGRYFFLDGNWSPYVGGGLAFDGLVFNKTAWEEEVDADGAAGMGAYIDVGFEFLRLYGTRLSAHFRVDLPFFDVGSNWFGQGGGASYFVPLSFGVGFSW